jgi:shikimate dehydrogenase
MKNEKSVTGNTSLYCIIGMPAHHSLSPTIHNAMYRKLGMDAVFLAFDVAPEYLEDAIHGMKAFGIKGMTLTSPHKQEVMKYMDHIDPLAKELGAVNGVVIKNGKFYGYNTDEPGAIMSLERHGMDKKGSYALFGAGGAARAIAFGLAHKGVKSLYIINRTLKHAEGLKLDLKKRFPKMAIEVAALGSAKAKNAIKESKYLLNATNITLENSKDTPVPARLLSKEKVVFDANYVPIKNRLLSDAKRNGCVTINGLELLVYNQAVAFELFTRRKSDDKIMMEAAEKAANG